MSLSSIEREGLPGPLGCVLAGGLSSRMGRDKALLSWRGGTLIEHALDRLRAAGCTPVIAGTRPDLAHLAPVLEDHRPGCGPLAGIEAALVSLVHAEKAPRHPMQEMVLFLPVDLPLLPARFFRILLERALLTGAAATIPIAGGRAQPLCAVYTVELLDAVSSALARGAFRVSAPLAGLAPRRIDRFAVEAVTAASSQRGRELGEAPAHLWFANLNAPGDLAALKDG